MKEILYTTGPKKITMGKAGEFKRGVAKKIDDDLADALLKKTTVKFYEAGTVPAAAEKTMKALEAAEEAAKKAAKPAAIEPARKAAAKKEA